MLFRVLGTAILGLSLAGGGHAETLKVGYPTAAPASPIFIAKEKGYYAAQGLDVELVPFDAAGPIAVAVTSGSLDFALAGSFAHFKYIWDRLEGPIPRAKPALDQPRLSTMAMERTPYATPMEKLTRRSALAIC
jgi:ABC-type nitrate/sulfonate/bicarbonate transport system substrate-binding protein